MERRLLYLTLLILGILTLSSFYLSWSVDRGMGEITVERRVIEPEPGHQVSFLVYQPRTANHYQPMPIVLTIHGLAGSKEGMYAFNIELARRNFTVVSVDLPGHGDSPLPFELDQYHSMAEDAYAALSYVQNTWAHVDNSAYGVLSHSLGLRVAVELQDFAIAPLAYVTVGDVGQTGEGGYLDLPGNMLMAIGESDEMIPTSTALEAIRYVTGNASAEAGVTYGSFTNETAYKLAFAQTNHLFEATDPTIVSESIAWLVQGVQGGNHLQHTLDPTSQVFSFKTVGMMVGTVSLLAAVIPFMALIHSFMPKRIRPREITSDCPSLSVSKRVVYGSLLGAIPIAVYAIASSVGLQLENSGMALLDSMFATGLGLFYVLTAVGMALTLYVLLGRDAFSAALAAVGIGRSNLAENLKDLVKGLFLASLTVVWFMTFLSLCGLEEWMQPWISLSLLRWPVWQRGINTLIIAALAVPYLVMDSIMMRGVLRVNRDSGDPLSRVKDVALVFVGKFAIMAVLAFAFSLGTAALGILTVEVTLLSLPLLLFLVINLLVTTISVWTIVDLENTWPAVFVGAFLLALVAISSVPLI
ncbi:MAG: alpha/beta hydrolase family protein [Candidatus Thorarchaeota archaeon]